MKLARPLPALLAAACLLPAVSFAGEEAFSIEAEIGAAERNTQAFEPGLTTGLGGYAGGRAELNLLFHVKADARGSVGRVFGEEGTVRMFELSSSASTPELLFVALDAHEFYLRTGGDDDLLYANGGLATKMNILGRLKLGGGVTYLQAGHGDTKDTRLGGYAGAEHMVRSARVDTNLRAAALFTPSGGALATGIVADGDLFLKFDVGPLELGPRLDVAYRNFDLSGTGAGLASSPELSANLGLAVRWGSGAR